MFSDPEYSWFWLAATGAMYDYFTGTVTTDAYGRDAYKKDSYGKNDMHYKTIVMEMMATGGAMLRAINDVASFRQKLSRNEFPYRRDGHPLRRTANREVTALVYEIAEILDDIQTKVNSAIMAKNDKERTRISEKKKAGEDLNDELPDVDWPEVPQYKSFLRCLSDIRYLLVQEREKMFPPLGGTRLFVEWLRDISKLMRKEQDKLHRETSKKEPSNEAPK